MIKGDLFVGSLCLIATKLGFIILTMPEMISKKATISSVCGYGRFQNHISSSIPVIILHIYCLSVTAILLASWLPS